MLLAVSQLVVPADLPVEQFFRRAKEAGFEGVELSIRAADRSVFDFDTSFEEVESFMEISRHYRLPVVSVTINPAAGNLLDSGPAAEAGIALAIHGLECAKKLGAKVALHTLGRLSPELYYEDAYCNAIASVQAIMPAAERLGIDFAVEFVWNGFLFSPLEMRNFLRAVGSPRAGFYFDPGNMAVFQYPQHWVRALANELKHVHLKDWRGGALNGEWTPLTEGTVDFPVIMRELRSAGYRGPLVSEVPESLASWEKTADAMRRIAMM